MLLGDTCTRGCRFCAVTTGNPKGAVDVREPEHVAQALAKMELQYVVMTMVDRDDLIDGGATHVARTVTRLRELRPDMLIETLLGDFLGRSEPLEVTVDAAPNVWAHNVEVVERLQRTIRDVRCSYAQSLGVLERVKQRAPEMITKSSIMVGIGENDDEVLQTMRDLRAVGVDIVTLGQYLRPTAKHAEVRRFVEPAMFDTYAEEGNKMGFAFVASGPLVRSSYKAAEVFVRSTLDGATREETDRIMKERLATAQDAARKHGDPSMHAGASELAARATAALLVPAASLVRR
jgi:lipoic acid synthetase